VVVIVLAPKPEMDDGDEQDADADALQEVEVKDNEEDDAEDWLLITSTLKSLVAAERSKVERDSAFGLFSPSATSIEARRLMSTVVPTRLSLKPDYCRILVLSDGTVLQGLKHVDMDKAPYEGSLLRWRRRRGKVVKTKEFDSRPPSDRNTPEAANTNEGEDEDEENECIQRIQLRYCVWSMFEIEDSAVVVMSWDSKYSVWSFDEQRLRLVSSGHIHSAVFDVTSYSSTTSFSSSSSSSSSSSPGRLRQHEQQHVDELFDDGIEREEDDEEGVLNAKRTPPAAEATEHRSRLLQKRFVAWSIRYADLGYEDDELESGIVEARDLQTGGLLLSYRVRGRVVVPKLKGIASGINDGCEGGQETLSILSDRHLFVYKQATGELLRSWEHHPNYRLGIYAAGDRFDSILPVCIGLDNSFAIHLWRPLTTSTTLQPSIGDIDTREPTGTIVAEWIFGEVPKRRRGGVLAGFFCWVQGFGGNLMVASESENDISFQTQRLIYKL